MRKSDNNNRRIMHAEEQHTATSTTTTCYKVCMYDNSSSIAWYCCCLLFVVLPSHGPSRLDIERIYRTKMDIARAHRHVPPHYMVIGVVFIFFPIFLYFCSISIRIFVGRTHTSSNRSIAQHHHLVSFPGVRATLSAVERRMHNICCCCLLF